MCPEHARLNDLIPKDGAQCASSTDRWGSSSPCALTWNGGTHAVEYIGMDVHKRYCQVAILDDNDTSTDPDECRVRTDRDELDAFAQNHAEATVAIEASRNHRFVYDCLTEHVDVTVTNPYKTRLIGEQKVKNDRLDAKRLAILLKADVLPTSYIPPDELRDARKLVRGRHSLVQDRTSAKNRIKSVLAERGITYNGDVSSEDGRAFLADDELPLSEIDRQRIEADLAVIGTFDEQIAEMTATINKLATTWEEPQRIMTIPGLGPITSMIITAEIGEFDRFDEKTQVVSYAGLDPAVNQSGEKDTTGGITKEGPSLLRWGVVQGALNAVRHDTYLGNYYTRLKETKPKKEALVATARKLRVMIYAMVTKEETYDPPGAPHG